MESIFKSFNSLNTPSFSMPEITTWGIVCIGWMFLIGMITAAITYSMSGGERDFNSIQQVVATHYEVLAEHKVAAQAREMVSDMPFMRAKAFEG